MDAPVIDMPANSGDRISPSEVELPGGRARGPVLTLGRGPYLHRFQASQPFPLVRVIYGQKGSAERAPPDSLEQGGPSVVGP